MGKGEFTYLVTELLNPEDERPVRLFTRKRELLKWLKTDEAPAYGSLYKFDDRGVLVAETCTLDGGWSKVNAG